MKRSYKFPLLLAILLFLPSCVGQKDDSSNEKQRYIDATIEVSCLVIDSDNLKKTLSAENRPEINAKIIGIFKNHGFDADNDKLMEAISAKYELDDDVYKGVQENMDRCNKK